jgi:hypothetical protein
MPQNQLPLGMPHNQIAQNQLLPSISQYNQFAFAMSQNQLWHMMSQNQLQPGLSQNQLPPTIWPQGWTLPLVCQYNPQWPVGWEGSQGPWTLISVPNFEITTTTYVAYQPLMGITSIQYWHQPSTWPMVPTSTNMQQMPAIIQEALTVIATTFAC